MERERERGVIVLEEPDKKTDNGPTALPNIHWAEKEGESWIGREKARLIGSHVLTQANWHVISCVDNLLRDLSKNK